MTIGDYQNHFRFHFSPPIVAPRARGILSVVCWIVKARDRLICKSFLAVIIVVVNNRLLLLLLISFHIVGLVRIICYSTTWLQCNRLISWIVITMDWNRQSLLLPLDLIFVCISFFFFHNQQYSLILFLSEKLAVSFVYYQFLILVLPTNSDYIWKH